ncbi:DNA repair protein RadC (plasmid) [Pseudomonas silvicola]|nr:DNA repair protein RadC [Pseudomonas silvicola]WAH62279.1 DNA repair protein RadC [Pseudomonas silvicola]
MQGLTKQELRIVDKARDILMAHMRKAGVSLESPEAVRRYLELELMNEPNEWFCVIMLDTRHRVITFERLFQGSISTASVYPRVIVQRALSENAAALIIAHNHPSGCPQPSQADRVLTARIKEALSLVEISLLDHFVVGQGVYSFAENGLL